MVQVSWQQIRSLGGSQREGFEELCCQLAHTEPVPGGIRFDRKGKPDAGLECFWTLANGDEWGWQAKFLTSIGPTQWRECDASVRTALEKHPRLKRFYLCVTAEFPDARIGRQLSALAQWNRRVTKWSEWASARHMTVEFIRWDVHELLFRLSKPEHQGRLWFWFSAPALNLSWFENAVKVAVRQAHDRYTPEIHFELDLAGRFAALARDRSFQGKLQKAVADLDGLRSTCRPLEGIAAVAKETGALQAGLAKAQAAAAALPDDMRITLDYGPVLNAIESAQNGARIALEAVWDWRRNAAHQAGPAAPATPQPLPSDDTEYSLRDIQAELRKTERTYRADDARLATLPAMLLSGDAGFGKTHLLCSVAERRAAAGLPVVLLLGERFDGSEPWTNALQLLGLPCTRDEFLGALDAAGEASGCRALLLIDAINEGVGIDFWKRHLAAMLAEVRRYPHVGIVISVRSAYEPQLENLLARDTVRISHHGFSGQVAAASRHFFQRYGLAEPNVPILNPEFENPLFLKLVCVAVKESGHPEVPATLRGVTTVFSFILASVNRRLAASLDYDEKEDRVAQAVQRLAQLMAEQGSEFLPVDLVKQELGKIHASHNFSGSLFRHLIAEHIVVRVPRSVSRGVYGEFVRFTYQRLSDHLIVRSLLTGLTTKEAGSLFKKGGKLAHYAAPTFRLYAVAGWVEALAIQLPETHGWEIDELVSFGMVDDLIRRAFVASLVWRKPAAFTPKTAKRVGDILRDPRTEHAHELLDALVSISAVADHPYNGHWLDAWLRPHSMAERDAFWSIYLFGKGEEETSILRLIEWAWAERPAVRFPDNVIQPAALALAWCLTTSDRFVRDRATKALVALLESRLDLVLWLLRHFSDIDEHYVQERLYAAAAGCAWRNPRATGLSELAQYIYDSLFRDGAPPVSVLRRDHARGVVEVARRHGTALNLDPQRLIPPYASAWPKAPPSLSRLHTLYGDDDVNTQDQGLRRIIHSVTMDDFNHYVINDVHWWHKRRRKGRKLSPREEFARMVATADEGNASLLERYAESWRRLGLKPSQYSPGDGRDDERREFIKSMDHMLHLIVGRSRVAGFRSRIVPYLQDSWNERYEQSFPTGLFQRLILRRVLELGWTSERFGEFDANIHDRRGREANKPERIGKKYQWIAYDEFHARISDNFGLADSRTGIMESQEWERGTWPAGMRDLDPTLLLKATPRYGYRPSELSWWTPFVHSDWGAGLARQDWLQRTTDLPPVPAFLSVKRPDGTPWLMLHNYTSWRRHEFGEDSWHEEHERYEVHYIIRSYFTRRAHLPAIMAWGRKQDWINDLLPSPQHDYRQHLHEHYQGLHFDGPLEDHWIGELHFSKHLPHPVLPTTADYLCEQSTYDCSMDETVSISIPARALVQMAGLQVVGRRGEFANATGQVVAFDPTTYEPGHSGLAYREDAMREFLQRNDLALFWTLLGEKNVYSPRSSQKWHGRQTMLGIYSWTEDRIEGDFRSEWNPARD